MSPLTERDAANLARFNRRPEPSIPYSFLPHAYDKPTLARHVDRHSRGEDRRLLAFSGDKVAPYAFLREYYQPFPLLGLGVTDRW